MTILFQVLIIILIVVLGSFVQQIRMRRKHPPGPLGLPFVGVKPFNILKTFFPQLFSASTENEFFTNMKKMYGDIWSLDLGDKKIIVLASADTISEAYHDNGKYFLGKPTNEFYKILSDGRGIVFNDGDISNSNRLLAIKALRDMGMGKQLIETQVNEQIEELMENIDRTPSGCVTSPTSLIKSISNISYQVVFNMKTKDDDPEFDIFIKDMQTVFHSNEATDILQCFLNILPRAYVRKLFTIVDVFLTSHSRSLKFIEKLCKDRIKIESEFAKPTCVFDFFWRYRYQDHPEIKYEEKLYDISHSMYDVFVGSLDTATNLLSFCFLALGQYRDVQEDIRTEIQSLVDTHKLINMEMRKNCPKLLSFIDEMQRISALAPRIPRRTLSNFTLRNYEITTDDIVLGDIYTAFRDPKLFENPDDFNAYRFLDESRTKYIPNKSIIPFGMGKRICLGESLAVMEMFMFLSKMILKYDILLPKSTKDNFDKIFAGSWGLLHKPLNHEIIFRSTNS